MKNCIPGRYTLSTLAEQIKHAVRGETYEREKDSKWKKTFSINVSSLREKKLGIGVLVT